MGLVKILESGQRIFWCPGCGCLHRFNAPNWEWNEDKAAPTIWPSIVVDYEGRPPANRPDKCHLVVRDGKIEYLADSTHHLSGKTVGMEDLDDV